MVVRERGSWLLDRLRCCLVPSDEWPLSREQVFHVLSGRRRRRVIVHLAGERELAVEELVDRITAEELSDDGGDDNRRNAVYASLYQTHLPTLVDAGIVERHADGTQVRITDRGQWIHSYLATYPGQHPRREAVFLAESLLWAVIFLVSIAGLPIVRVVPPQLLLAGCLGTFFATAFGYWWSFP